MQISLRDLIIPLLGSQTWPAGLFQGPHCRCVSTILNSESPFLDLFYGMCFNNCFVFQSFTTSKVSFIGFLQLYLFQPLLQLFFAIEGFFQTFHYIFQPLQVCLNHSQPLKYHSLDLFNRVKAITASANPRAAAMFR